MKKYLRTMAGFLLITLLLSGCGSVSYNKNAVADMAATETFEMSEAVSDVEMDTAAGSVGLSEVQAENRKLIRNVSMSVETRGFDELLENIQTKVTELGGYIENSSVSSGRYGNETRNRYSYMTLRIPSDRLDEFIGDVKEISNVTDLNESTEDVTLQYVDMESRIKALETEQSRLLELLEQAATVEDIITIEGRLSNVRYELESYTSQLRTLDNQVDYSSVKLDIREVERETTVEELGFWEEVADRFGDNVYDLGNSLRSLAIWFFSSVPYLLLWAAVIAVAAVIVKAVRKKKALRDVLKKQKTEVTEDKTEE